MNVDLELETWRRQWQSVSLATPDLRKRVERQSRLLKLALIADTLVTVGIGGPTAAWAFLSPQPDIILLAVVTWILLAVAWAFRLRVTRGNWGPAALDAQAFVEFLVGRCRAQLAAIRFGAVLFAVNLAFSVAWVWHHQPRPNIAWIGWRMDLVWLATLAFYVFLPWWNRRKKQELSWLLSLRESGEN
jgi:hypothetical protein